VEHVKVTGNHAHVKFSRPYPEAEFREAMSYRVKSWFFIPAVKNGTWDGYKSLLAHHTISTGLYRAIRSQLEHINEIKFDECIELNDPPPALEGFRSDRVYQNDAVQAMIDSVPLGGGTVLAATASGKTAVAGLFYSRVDGNHLFIVDQRKLLHQSRKDIAHWLQEPVGIIGDGKFEIERVNVATIQTLSNPKKVEKLLRWLGCLETVVVDEIHVQLSRRNFEVVANLQPRARFGLTATLQMDDKEVWLRVSAFSGPIIFTYPIERGIREGVLSKVRYVQIRFPPIVTPSEIKRDKERAKDFDTGKIDKNMLTVDHLRDNILFHREKNICIRKLVRGYLKRNRYIVILADRLDHIEQVRKNTYEFDPQVISGRVKVVEQDKIIDLFERGINRLIIASRVFNKGISIKRIDTIINVGETEDANTIVQQIGRELRLHDDKNGSIFVDLAGTTGRGRESGEARLKAVRAAGIPAEVYSWNRDQQKFWDAVAPPKRTKERM
jgi:superfamily II DNA or RNA helicase